MGNDPVQHKLWSIPGDGVLARQGNLVLLVSIEDHNFAESLLDLLVRTHEAGGDGRALTEAISTQVEGHNSWGGLETGPSVVAFGPAGAGLSFAVSGNALVEFNTSHGTDQFTAGHPSMVLRSAVGVPVQGVRATLNRDGSGDRTDRFSRLDSGTVRAGGLSYYAAHPDYPPPQPDYPASQPDYPASQPGYPSQPDAPAIPSRSEHMEQVLPPIPAPEPVASYPEPVAAADSTEMPAAVGTEAPEGAEVPNDTAAPDSTLAPNGTATPDSTAAPDSTEAAEEPGPLNAGPLVNPEPLASANPTPFPPPTVFRQSDSGSMPPVALEPEPYTHTPAEYGSMPPPGDEPSPWETGPAATGPIAAGPAETTPGPAVGGPGTDEPPAAWPATPHTRVDEAAVSVPEQPQTPGYAAEAGENASAPIVLGVYCKNGHFTDPDARSCVVCGTGIKKRSAEPQPGPRPPLGVLILDDGSALVVDSDYVIGRNPIRDQSVSAGTARPLRVVDAESMVSRIHARLHLNGWQVLLTDLGSVNGTRIQPPGAKNQPPMVLQPQVPVALQHSTFIYVGSACLRYEQASG